MGNLGLPELIIIFVIVILLFGAKKIPDIAKGLGKGIRDFKKASSGELDEEEKKKSDTDQKISSKPTGDQPPKNSSDHK